jgi:5'-nucleotidase
MPHVSTALRATALALLLAGCTHTVQPVDVTIAAVNDFHGNLQSTPLSYADADAPGGKVSLKAGGINALSGAIAELRRHDPQLLLIGAGDMIGGSPPISAMWADEPTLEAFNLLDLKFSVVGNHELDQGKAELLRQIRGGCDSVRPDKACQFNPDYSGTRFPYLAANLMDSSTSEPLLPAYVIEQAHGARIAFVGAVLRDVSRYVSASSMNGLYTIDEADAINAQLPALRQQGVDAVVAVIHQGGATPESFSTPDCSQLSGDIVEVAKRLDPQIQVVVTAHTHQGYLCKLGDKYITQGASYGRLLTQLTLSVDPVAHRLLGVKARNIVVDPKLYAPTADIATLQAQVEARSHTQLNRPIARIAARQVDRRLNAAGESALGDLVADAQLAATRPLGAQVAFTNMGGMRSDLILEPGQEQLTYAQVASLQPFNNTLNVLTLTGEQLKALLEQQWQDTAFGFYPLQPSASLNYRWDASQPKGQRIIASSLRIDGEPVHPALTYRVSVNSFMADGGDNFTLFKQASERVDTGINDLQALIDYLQQHDRAGTPVGVDTAAQRIQRVGAAALAGAGQ